MADELVDSGAAAVAESPAPVETAAVETTVPAVAAEPEATTEVEAEAPARPTRNPGEDPYSYMKRVREAKTAKPGEVAKPATTSATDKATTTAAKTPEEIAAEADKAAKQPDKEADKQAAETAEAPSPFEEYVPLAPSKLAEILKANPELEATLEAAGIGKDALAATSRLAVQGAEYAEMFGDKETAQFAKETAQQFAVMEDDFTEIKDPESLRGFLKHMVEMDYVLGPDGKPQLNEQGVPIVTGHVFRFLNMIVDQSLNNLGATVAGKDDDASQELQTALQIVKARLTGETASPVDEPEEIKAQRAALSAEKEGLNQQRQEAAKAKFEEFESGVLTESSKQIDDLITSVLERSDLPEKLRPSALRDIREKLYETLAGNKLFTSRRDQLMRKGLTPDTHKSRVAHNINTTRGVFKKIAEGVLRDTYGSSLQEKQQSKLTKIAEQVGASKSEPRGTAAPARPGTGAGKFSDLVAQVTAKYQAEHGGEMPDTATKLRLARAAQTA